MCMYAPIIEVGSNIQSRHKVMHQIEEVECFANCTKLCKPHESNKAVWEIWSNMGNMSAAEKKSYAKALLAEQEEVKKRITHPEFI